LASTPFVFRKQPTKAWPGFNDDIVKQVLPSVLNHYPVDSWIALGADCPESSGHYIQQAWVCRTGQKDKLEIHTITREKTDLPQRIIEIGPIKAAFFVSCHLALWLAP
jgi:hypothetical protein